MSTSERVALLPDGIDVPFSGIPAALSKMHADPQRSRAQGNALTATVVVCGPYDRLPSAAAALGHLGEPAGLRAILISFGDNPMPAARIAGGTIAIEGLRPEYLNNAVAALRLSSLPTLVWWRGGTAETLSDLAELADRVLLDTDDVDTVWPRAAELFARAAFSDLRWTRLTRWRALMAHFFDIPQVRAAAPSFTAFHVIGSDAPMMRLMAGWLSSSLRWTGAVRVTLDVDDGVAPIERVELGDGDQRLTLALGPSRTCVESTAIVAGHSGASRVVALGDHGLPTLIAEELRVRSRDLAFEEAVAAAGAFA